MFNVNIHEDHEKEVDEIEEDDYKEALYETIRYLWMAIQAILYMINDCTNNMCCAHTTRSLTRRLKTRYGYDYIHEILKEDPENFRQVYRMYPDIFLKLSTILREKGFLRDTRYICIEEMLTTFLLIVGQNTRYCLIRQNFGRSHFTTSRSFNKILQTLNKFAIDIMVKPGSVVPEKIRESTRFYLYFKDCIGAIDDTHIPAMVTGRDTSSYRNRH
ncbi:uncharacterized protein LOC111410600 isoform X1 [Olea europaea var. sylvestris]|uniref:uncharacterized protein LOC111410600 isoform X1 n=1 Tax=Olea europaea var. sylvestris TaxID=158386 RepID=UPI000C1D7B3B|nr:uncharacterized protein LOC111410600 isoform X1 [Olea europaea var. sylvestris]